MIYRTIFLFGISLLFIQTTISAQSSDTIATKKIVLIKKTDGGEFIGEIISNNDREILIQTKLLSVGFILIKVIFRPFRSLMKMKKSRMKMENFEPKDHLLQDIISLIMHFH